MSRSNFTDKLVGYTNISSLEFITDEKSGVCTLNMVLRRPSTVVQDNLRVEFSGVSNLNVKDIGGGISQFLFLLIEDVRESQLDRVNFQVREMERDSISFFCQSISIIL